MKWTFILLILCCLGIPGQAGGQHFIGKHKTEVRRLMKEQRKEFHEDKKARNTVYNMLKYLGGHGNQTLYYFFSESDTCLYSKWICDYSMLNKVVSGLNRKYRQTAEDSWHYVHENQDYLITLTAGDWFFTIMTKAEAAKKDH